MDNDAVVLNIGSFLLINFGGRDDLTLVLADLVLFLHVVPELGFCEHEITRENNHSLKRGIRIIIAVESSYDDVKLLYLLLVRCNTKFFDHF